MLAISQFFYLYANIILADACLGYLGIRQLRFPSLGGLLAAEIGFYDVSFLPVFIPAAAISILIILLNLAGGYFKNKYKRVDTKKFEKEFAERFKDSKDLFKDIPNIGQLLYLRKTGSEFAAEMRRSVKVAITDWCD